MTDYIFRLDNFRITNTRARHNDTDYVGFTYKVGNNQLQPRTERIGDLNNGTYGLSWEFGPISITDPNTLVIFNYQIVNAGNKNQSAVKKGLESAGDGLINAGGAIFTDSLGGGIWGIIIGGGVALASIGLGELMNILFADCDGLVAVDQVAVNGSTLEGWVANSGSHTETRYYPGYDSAVGCGSNSTYYVTWSVRKA